MSDRTVVSVMTSMGPPPYVGGIENVVDCLLHSELAERYRFELYDSYREPDPGRSWLEKSWTLPRIAASSRAHLATHRPAIAHIHFCSRADFWKHSVCLWRARQAGARTIFHLHGGSFDAFHGGLAAPMRAFVHEIFRWPDRIVALSSYWQDFLAEFADPGRIRTLNNPIDCDRLAPEGSRRPDPAAPEILLLGSLGRRKGHYETLEAFERVVAAHPKARLLFAGGEEDPGARDRLEAICRERGLNERVSFLGPIGFEAKTDRLRRASVLVLASFGENMPIAVLEAMAAGVPVVASRTGAVPEVLDEGRVGRLVDAGDADGIADAILGLLADPAAAEAMGQAARARARARWDVSVIAEQVEAIYAELLAR